MKILVTGIAGFIGSHLAHKLLSMGHSVVGLDNYNDYYAPHVKRQNVAALQLHSNAHLLALYEGDLRDETFIQGIFQQEAIDAIAHLGAMAGVRNSIDYPKLYMDVNLTGTLYLLNEAVKHNIQNFVFASTSSVYGNTKQIPFLETDVCDRVLAPYAASKRACEMLGFTYHHLHKLNFTGLRFFTVYGERGRPDMMPYKIMENIFKGTVFPLYNHGQMLRDWTYVEDIVQGITKAIEKPLGYEIFNIGRGEPLLLADFVQIAEELAGKETTLASTSEVLKADMLSTFASIEKAQKMLGYQPITDVKVGVAKLMDWYKKEVLLDA